MPGDIFALVSSGQVVEIAADVWNDFLRMRQDWRNSKRTSATGPGSAAAIANPAAVLIENDSGVDCPRYGVLAINRDPDDLLLDPDENFVGYQQIVLLSGVLPSFPNDCGSFVVTLEAIKAGAIGYAATSGVVQVPIQVNQYTDGLLTADILDSDVTRLQLCPGGANCWHQAYDDGGGGGGGDESYQGDPDPQNQTLWGYVELGTREGIAKAQMNSDEDGTHAKGEIKNYNLLTPSNSTAIVPVTNSVKDVKADARLATAFLSGVNGVYQLIAIDACGSHG